MVKKGRKQWQIIIIIIVDDDDDDDDGDNIERINWIIDDKQF